jgi:tetraprenyl-beta-curcumene synthase
VRYASLTGVFAGAALRYWLAVFPCVCRELAPWRRRAAEIPDPALRRLALQALGERGNTEGAAAFAAFAPRTRRGAVVRALVAFQSAYSFADILAEQPSVDPVVNGRQLHTALAVALEPGVPHPDYYRHHARRDDGGYLGAIVDASRGALCALPSYAAMARTAARAAARIVACQSLSLGRRPDERDALKRCAREQAPRGSDLRWWETVAAGGSSLGVHMLIATAADQVLAPEEPDAIEGAYFPWIGALHSLLDSLVDEAEDAELGQLSLVGCYADRQETAARMSSIAARAARGARELPHAGRHGVLLAAMVSYYLSDPELSTADAAPVRANILGPVGYPAKLAMPVFRARRAAECLSANRRQANRRHPLTGARPGHRQSG